MHPYFSHTPYPLQLVADIPPAVEGVLVITSRGHKELLRLPERLRATALPAAIHEVIVVCYDSDLDDDAVIRQNTDHFWALTKALAQESQVHLLLWHHLPEPVADAAAVRIGMDEAARRLDIAAPECGWIFHLPADVTWEGDLLWETHRYFKEHSSANYCTYPMQSMRVTHKSYLGELAYRYHLEGFAFAELPAGIPYFAIRQRAYVEAGGWSLEGTQRLATPVGYAHQRASVTAGRIRLLADFEKNPVWRNNTWVDPMAFWEIREWQHKLPSLFHVRELSSYGEWLKGVSPTVAAGLQELGFFTFWKDQLLGCSDEQHFLSTLRHWLSPERATILGLSASFTPASENPRETVAHLLELIIGYPPERYDLVYLLEQFRQLEEHRSLPRVEKEKAG